MKKTVDSIHKIRSFNRFYTNILGLLNQHILESGYSLTEVRVMLEISKINHCTANALATQLNIDRSYMSRIIKNLERNELITRVQSTKDNRVNFITLTMKGTETITNLNKKSNEQIFSLIQPLDQNQLANVTEAMEIIKNILSNNSNSIVIRNFIVEDIHYVISRHRVLYKEEYGLTPVFSDYVDKGVHHFAKHYDKNCECMLIAEIEKKPIGSIVIVKSDNSIAQLRYFLIEPEIRGRGLGHRLVKLALDFCREKGYKHVFLETISSLKTARHIYKSHGFSLTTCHENPTWGKNVLEERWDLDL
jgi:DNA-binding MarR family transcriptional regulator/GNAT superfamily N-acetyltransferase